MDAVVEYEPVKKKRGPKRGSTNKKRGVKAKVNRTNLTQSPSKVIEVLESMSNVKQLEKAKKELRFLDMKKNRSGSKEKEDAIESGQTEQKNTVEEDTLPTSTEGEEIGEKPNKLPVDYFYGVEHRELMERHQNKFLFRKPDKPIIINASLQSRYKFKYRFSFNSTTFWMNEDKTRSVLITDTNDIPAIHKTALKIKMGIMKRAARR